MKTRCWIAALAIAVAMGAAVGGACAADAPKCAIDVLGEMRLELVHGSPMIDGTIDGHPIHALLDTGSNRTVVTGATAAALHLPERSFAGEAYSVDGFSRVGSTHVGSLHLGTYTAGQLDLFVIGAKPELYDMIVGLDFLSRFDLELDFRAQKVRFLKINPRCTDEEIPFWTKAGQAYSVVPMVTGSDTESHFFAPVELNGVVVRAQLDTGAARSVANRSIASSVGVTNLQSDAVVRGATGAEHASDVGQLESFSMGDEHIGHTRLIFSTISRAPKVAAATRSRIRSTADDAPDLYLGADFIAAHHILISPRRGKIYFTYEGGPVFETRPAAPPSTP